MARPRQITRLGGGSMKSKKELLTVSLTNTKALTFFRFTMMNPYNDKATLLKPIKNSPRTRDPP